MKNQEVIKAMQNFNDKNSSFESLDREIVAIIAARRLCNAIVRFNVAENIKEQGRNFAFDVIDDFTSALSSMEETYVSSEDKTLTEENILQIYNALEALSTARDFLLLERYPDEKASSTLLEEDKNYFTRDVKYGFEYPKYHSSRMKDALYEDSLGVLKASQQVADDLASFRNIDEMLYYFSDVLESEVREKDCLGLFIKNGSLNPQFLSNSMRSADNEIASGMTKIYGVLFDGKGEITPALYELGGKVDVARKIRGFSWLYTIAPNLAFGLFMDEMKEMQAIKYIMKNYSHRAEHSRTPMIIANAKNFAEITRRMYPSSPKYRMIPTFSSQLSNRAHQAILLSRQRQHDD